MKPEDFDAAVKRLELLFRPLEEDQVNLYWEAFQKIPKILFDDAVRLLVSYHPYKRFPFPAEIWRAIYVARDNREAAIEKKWEPPCPLCEGMGWKLEKREDEDKVSREVAVYCSCARGQRMREGFLKGKKKSGRRLEYPGETDGARGDPGLYDGDETKEE